MRGRGIRYLVAHRPGARVFHVAVDAGLVELTHGAFCAGVSRALEFLGAVGEFPLANVFLAPSRAEFDRFVGHLTTTPTSKGRVGQAQGHDLYLLSPTAYPEEASPSWLGPDGSFDVGLYERLIAHEAVHVVEEHLSPRDAMEHRPAWWSEGLAVLLSEQYIHDRDVLDHMQADLDAERFPALDEMNGERAYTWGWAAVACALRSQGRARVAEVVTSTSGSDLLAPLGLDRAAFEVELRAFGVAEARRCLARREP